MGIADYILLILIGTGAFMAVRSISKSKKAGRCIGCLGSCEGCKQKNKKTTNKKSYKI